MYKLRVKADCALMTSRLKICTARQRYLGSIAEPTATIVCQRERATTEVAVVPGSKLCN